MRYIATSMLLAMLLSGGAYAQPLKPMAKGSFDGTPLDQAMSTLHVLGKWILPRHGSVQVFTMAGSSHQAGCIGDETDPDRCTGARLYVAAEDSLIVTKGLTTKFGQETYFLLRGVDGTGWYLSKNETLKFISENHFSLLVCGSKFMTKLSGGAIVPTAYIVNIIRSLGGDKKYTFRATMENIDSRMPRGCGMDQIMLRDENFHTVPSLIKPGKAPR